MGVPFYIVTGFLGSGKTTLVNRLLSGMTAKRVGVIVNDFGSVCVDASLISGGRSPEGASAVTVRELRNGQLFCSCLVGSFIDAAASFAGSGIDALWVEASGLAKPASLLDTLGEIETRTGGEFDFRGMVCVVDASRFLVLSSVLRAIEEQIAYSRFVVVNKTDLVSAAELARVDEAVRSLNPGCAILQADHGNLPPNAFETADPAPAVKPKDPLYAGWGEGGRPLAFTLKSERALAAAELRSFLAAVAPRSYRIKGFVETTEGLSLVDCVGAEVIISEAATSDRAATRDLGLVVISAEGDSLRADATRQWNRLQRFGSAVTSVPA
jgi:G3E family GTPase